MGLNSIQNPNISPRPSSRRRFLGQFAFYTAGTLCSIPISTQLAQSQKAETLEAKLYSVDPQTCLKEFLSMILEDASIKDKIDASNIQMISGLNNYGLQELYDRAIAAVKESNIPN